MEDIALTLQILVCILVVALMIAGDGSTPAGRCERCGDPTDVPPLCDSCQSSQL